MRIIYNDELLFKGIHLDIKKKLLNRIFEFSKTVMHQSHIMHIDIINQFKIKKMKGTSSIFKFYLPDGYRCLIQYEEKDTQIFDDDPGIILLRVTEHDNQGKVGVQLDGKYLNYEKFISFDQDSIVGNDEDFKSYLGHHFMKTFIVDQSISNDDLINKMLSFDGRAIYKLSEQQMLPLSNEGPTFLLGCAGSGKTLVEVSKALKNVHQDINQAYFTFTPMLKDVAEEIYHNYDKMNGIIGKTYFYTVKDYMLDALNLNRSQYFSFEMYLNWFKTNKYQNKYPFLRDIGPIDLWIEIRGMLKGFMGHEGIRILELNEIEKHIEKDAFDYLLNEEIITKKKNTHALYMIENIKYFHETLNSNMFKQLNSYYDRIMIESPLIDKTTYLDKVKFKYSQYGHDTKNSIYEFVIKNYQEYLKDKSLYDDNDLSRLMINRVNDKIPFDYILIDEVQDLTELQIYALTKQVKNKKNILMSGDVSQIINPNFFRQGRIGVLFRNLLNVNLNKDLVLDENYRNSQTIVEVSKSLLDIRQETLGKYSEDIEETSREIEKKDGLPFYVQTDKNEINDVLRLWIDVPKVVIVVASEKTKEELKKYYGIKKQTNIYTVHEIKGQEFDKIFLYNILSEHKESWDIIMSKTIDKGSDYVTKYKYYFNLFYVAFTRAKYNVFLYEEKPNQLIIERLIHHFEVIKDNLNQIMNLDQYDTEEHRLSQAETHFKNQDYGRAKTFYLQLDNKKMASICVGHSYLTKGNYLKAFEILYKYKKYHSTIFNYANEIDTQLFYVLIGFKLKKLQIEKIISILNHQSVMDLYHKTTKQNEKLKDLLFEDSFELFNIIQTMMFDQKMKEVKNIWKNTMN